MPHQMLKLPALILLVLTSIALLAGGDSQPAPTQPAPITPPLICIWQHPGFGPPDRPKGLIFALWPDGQALWAANPENAGKDITHGTIARAEINSFVTEPEVKESLIHKSQSYVPIDASSVEISLRIPGKDSASPSLACMEWTESFSTLSCDNDVDLSKCVDFAKRWTAIRIYCENLEQKAKDRTSNLKADDPLLRALGYNLDDPYQTPWIHEPKKTPHHPDE